MHTEAVQDATWVVELDDRRRLSLNRIARPEDSRYLATVDLTTGVITLTPAVVISAEDSVLLSHPAVLEALKVARTEAGALSRRGRLRE